MQTSHLYQRAYQVTYVIVLLLMCVSTWQSIQATEASWVMIAAVKMLPLLAFVPAVFKTNVRGLIWLSFVLCLYFTDAVVDSMTTTEIPLNVALAVTIAGLFTLILMYIRSNAKKRKAAATSAAE